jgi:hypothetical protein
MRRRGLLAAAALVVVSNASALLGVARNRASTLQTIDLTERELTLGYQGEENSGIDLRLQTNYTFGVYGSNMNWLDAAKLQELGFPAAVASRDASRDWLARPVYVALEYDGPAWQSLVAKELERPAGSVAAYIENQSHLVAVDASLSSETLLARYRNTGRHLIVRATVKPVVGSQFVEMINPQIHVPLPDALVLEKPEPPRLGTERRHYTVRLAYGARFEPWVISVTALPK